MVTVKVTAVVMEIGGIECEFSRITTVTHNCLTHVDRIAQNFEFNLDFVYKTKNCFIFYF